ncbi:type II toxin-antitoxin system Phd/YefM family antitoxin [Actinospongicola halichondriae]|uniref:type II toxin-antitoxin system Phd/YefM family antitoxin n=1 Tax=Actinospongicola halichondriae TaxID=3236844 RepID=UPI003D48378E
MESIGVRELRNSVAAVLRRAASGERITVTVDGVPTAQLGPLEPISAPTLDDLVATGLVEAPRRGREVTDANPIDPPVDIRLDDVLDALRGS